ncbi:accessory factor UbiK family protein [Roseomonas harenae]|uniref:accessory factor UbiK family protein n=1 Tax=Muricoccus harenae TaxID=2692566 RepID=UPI001915200A|nr:accessory factor UbiK family protein [Roseomonas harenae]
MQEGGQGSSGPQGGSQGSGSSGGSQGGSAGGPFGFGGFGQGGFGAGRGKFFDDLAGVAGGAFSVLAGARAEIESAVQAQVEALTVRLNLVKREELDAALEVARRAREEAESLAARVAALEARMDAMPPATPFEAGAGSGPSTPMGTTGTVPEGGSPGVTQPRVTQPGVTEPGVTQGE